MESTKKYSLSQESQKGRNVLQQTNLVSLDEKMSPRLRRHQWELYELSERQGMYFFKTQYANKCCVSFQGKFFLTFYGEPTKVSCINGKSFRKVFLR